MIPCDWPDCGDTNTAFQPDGLRLCSAHMEEFRALDAAGRLRELPERLREPVLSLRRRHDEHNRRFIEELARERVRGLIHN